MDVHIDLSATDAKFGLYASAGYELTAGGLSVAMSAAQFQQLCDWLRPWIVDDATPQPSAAEDYESWAKQERQREDTATRLGSAAVGAQGEGPAAAAWRAMGDENYLFGGGPFEDAHPEDQDAARRIAAAVLLAARAEPSRLRDALRCVLDIGSRRLLLPSEVVHWESLLAEASTTPAAGKGVDDVLDVVDDWCSPTLEAMSAIRAALAAALTRQPVAGKGVAEYVLALLVTGRYVTQAKVDEARRIALGCEPAQPADDDEAMVPGDADDMAEALAEISKTLGCDNTLDDILHAIHAIPRKEVAEGVVLALKEPTDAMNDAGGRSLNSDLGFPSYRADRAASAARNAYVTMLAAAPAATPTDGGEGKS